jgi:hypothetical protein
MLESVSTDIVCHAVLPFLQLRDLKSLRTVSRSIRERLPLSTESKEKYNLCRYVCGHEGCSNRSFLYTTVDPFVDYHEVTTGFLLNGPNFVLGLLIFPMYCMPFYRILYHLTKQTLPLITVETRESSAMALQVAVDSYRSIDDRIYMITSIRPMDFCTCTDLMERRSDHRAIDCIHVDWCTRTDKDGCIHCIMESTRTNFHWCLSTLPFSFYVYAGVSALLPMMSLLLMLIPVMFTIWFLMTLFCGPVFMMYILYLL